MRIQFVFTLCHCEWRDLSSNEIIYEHFANDFRAFDIKRRRRIRYVDKLLINNAVDS